MAADIVRDFCGNRVVIFGTLAGQCYKQRWTVASSFPGPFPYPAEKALGTRMGQSLVFLHSSPNWGLQTNASTLSNSNSFIFCQISAGKVITRARVHSVLHTSELYQSNESPLVYHIRDNHSQSLRLCSDEGLTLETSANTLFTAFSISTSTLCWYIVRFTATQTKASSHRA